MYEITTDTISDYQGLIHSIARKFRPDGVLICYEDLISVGNVAVLNFLPNHNSNVAKVTTYLYPLIKNAMRDEIRKFDILSRSERRKGGVVRRIHRQDMQDCVIANPEALTAFDRVDAKHTVASYLKGLSGKSRLILDLYYFSGLKLKSIAYLLDLTEGRISQVLAGCIRKLRRKAIIEQGATPNYR